MSNDIFTSLLLDCDKLNDELAINISKLLSSYIDSSIIDNIIESVNECLSSILLSRDELYNRISEYIINESIVNLNGVLSIPAAYRMTNKELDSKPSQYVSRIFQHLDTFLFRYNSKLSTDTKNILFNRIVLALKNTFISKANEVLDSVYYFLFRLKKLKKYLID